MRRYLSVAVLFFFLVWVVIALYRRPIFVNSPLETLRLSVDTHSAAQFKSLHRGYMFWHTLVLGNSDKYTYRPPRIVPGLTIQGRPAYKIYGMVTDWNPEDRLLELNTYTGKRMSVRFDPSQDQSMAQVPRLDNQGNIQEFGENDIITSTANVRFARLFCVSDIVMVVMQNKTDLMRLRPSSPVVPKEIHLSHRLCPHDEL